MNEEELLAAVHGLLWSGSGALECRELGHPAGHICLATADEVTLSALTEQLSGRYGEPRGLVRGGHVDPAVTERTGLPLLVPFGERLVEMSAWVYAGRWIGCGATRTGEGIRPVVVVAERPDPAADGLPEDTSWVDRIVAVTGWDPQRARTVDWAAVEARLGTALPGDYKRLAELFGLGAFDGFLQLSVPDAPFKSSDIVRQSRWLAEWARAHGNRLWEPYALFPAPGGLLEWAGSEQADRFYWLTEGPDPDKWPIVMSEEIPDSWQRFDGSTAEFIHRMLTVPDHPFSTARYFDVHWFQSYRSLEAAGD
ncbi:hypothetical protein [Streptomyces noursei]|uniref:Knr4/Smi1-like domain-containing protein n=1 Tax=Streptomyces noursei TaxID=1971 RepID=A0A2N8PHJ9_STRNR|nr:hypothetical protein [Streptomyces noursei]PNE40489.1 hypothetical protein AOB60_06070 [Streptomyces noursei]